MMKNIIEYQYSFNLIFALAVNAFTILNLLFLSLFLIFRKNNSLPNYVLAAIIFLPIFNFAHNILILNNNVNAVPFSFLIGNTIGIFIPLLIYRYTCFFVGKKFVLLQKNHILTGLSLLYFLYFDFYFLNKPFSEQHEFIRQVLEGNFPLRFVIGNGLFFGLTLIYTILSLKLIKK